MSILRPLSIKKGFNKQPSAYCIHVQFCTWLLCFALLSIVAPVCVPLLIDGAYRIGEAGKRKHFWSPLWAFKATHGPTVEMSSLWSHPTIKQAVPSSLSVSGESSEMGRPGSYPVNKVIPWVFHHCCALLSSGGQDNEVDCCVQTLWFCFLPEERFQNVRWRG